MVPFLSARAFRFRKKKEKEKAASLYLDCKCNIEYLNNDLGMLNQNT